MKTDSTMTEDKALIVVDQDEIPEDLPILTVEKQVAFPGLNMTLMISTDSLTLLEEAMKSNRVIGVLGVDEQTAQQPIPDPTSKIGTAARILYMTRAADNNAVLVVYGLTRFQITRWLSDKPYPRAQVTLAPEILEADIETEALHRSLRDLSRDVFSLSLNAPKEAVDALARVKDPLNLAYIAAAHADIDLIKQQNLLEEDSLKLKLRELVTVLSREKEVLSLPFP